MRPDMSPNIERLLEGLREARVRTSQEHDEVFREAIAKIQIGDHLADLLERCIRGGKNRVLSKRTIEDSVYYINEFKGYK